MGVIKAWQNNIEREIANLAAEADLYESRGEYALAEQLLGKLLTVKIGELGPKHPSIIEDFYNLGLLCYAQDKYVDAEDHLLRVLALEEQTGARPEQMAETTDLLAQLHFEQGNLAQAEKYCKQALILRNCGASPMEVNRALSRYNLQEHFAPN